MMARATCTDCDAERNVEPDGRCFECHEYARMVAVFERMAMANLGANFIAIGLAADLVEERELADWREETGEQAFRGVAADHGIAIPPAEPTP